MADLTPRQCFYPGAWEFMIMATSLPGFQDAVHEAQATFRALLNQKDAIIYDLYPSTCPMSGAKELTQRFYQAEIPQAIASSSSQRPFSAKSSLHEFDDQRWN